MKDPEIIENILRGEPHRSKAIEALHFNYKSKIIGMLYSLSSDITLDQAYEFFRVGIIIFFEAVLAGKLDEDTRIYGYLRKVCKRRFYDYVRSPRYSTRSSSGLESVRLPDNDCPETICLKEENEILLKEIFSKWDGNCLMYYQKKEAGKSHQEIAEILNISDDNVARQRWSQCKKYLFRIVMETREYLHFALGILYDKEIMRQFGRYESELDTIWTYVKKNCSPELKTFFQTKEQTDLNFRAFIQFLKNKSGYRKLVLPIWEVMKEFDVSVWESGTNDERIFWRIFISGCDFSSLSKKELHLFEEEILGTLMALNQQLLEQEKYELDEHEIRLIIDIQDYGKFRI